MKLRKIQQGTFIVEFAIIAAVMLVVLFAAIELPRMIWVWNTVDEATRRGARLAAVCEIKNPNVPVQEATIFSSGGSTSPILRGLSTANVDVEYLGGDGVKLTGTPAFEDVRYVRVRIKNYSVTPIIPFVNGSYSLPPFETTLPSESLGYIPDTDPPQFECL